MAPRKPPAPRAARPKSPTSAAIERLAKLAQAGTAPDRMAREVGAIVATWLADPEVDRGQVRDHVETLHEDLASGAEAAEEQAADVDQSETGAAKQAARTLAALRATRDALGVELERLR
jgi:hypothetical protein